MKKPSLGESLLLAAALAVAAVPLGWLGGFFFSSGFSTRLVWTALTLCYLSVGAGLRRGRVGSIVLFATSIGALLTTALMATTDRHLFACVLVIWAVRSLSRYSSFITTFADLCVSLASICFAYWAYQRTGSFMVSVWSLFLTQAVTALIPRRFDRRERTTSAKADRFDLAYGSAEQALRQIIGGAAS